MKTLSLVAITISIIALASNLIIERQEKHECLTWQTYETQFETYSSPNWAKEQCEQFNIELK